MGIRNNYEVMYEVLQKMEDDKYYEATPREKRILYSALYGNNQKIPNPKKMDNYGSSVNTNYL